MRVTDDSFELRPRGAPPLPGSPRPQVVKVGRQRERFWCVVERVCDDGSLVARIDNDLVHNPDLRFGERLRVQPEHILDAATEADEEEFHQVMKLCHRTLGAGYVPWGLELWREVRAGR